MPLTSVNTGDVITASQHNEAYNLLKTTTAPEWVTISHKGADIVSAGTLSLGSDGNYFDVTGTTGITSISSRQAGTQVVLQFDGAVTLTHSASLVLQGAANITTAAGDILVFIADSTTVWRQIGWLTASGFVTPTGTQTLTNKTLTAPVIADFTSAAHDHGDADDGGALVAAAVNGLTLTSMTLTSPTVNTQLTGTAVGTGASQVAQGSHTHAASSPTSAVARVDAAESTSASTDTGFIDLTTAGPAVTITTGTKALVTVGCRMTTGAAAGETDMGFVVSGASTLAADVERSQIFIQEASGSAYCGASRSILVTGLTAGSNTFTAKYRYVGTSSTAQFKSREISVIDLGS